MIFYNIDIITFKHIWNSSPKMFILHFWQNLKFLSILEYLRISTANLWLQVLNFITGFTYSLLNFKIYMVQFQKRDKDAYIKYNVYQVISSIFEFNGQMVMLW